VDDSNLLAGVDDVFNGISVRGDAIGDVMFFGRGAGKLPTASAVVADIIDAAKHIGSRKYLEWAPGGVDVVCSTERLHSCWYVRTNAGADELRAALGDVMLLTRTDAPAGETACITEAAMSRGELDEKLRGLGCLSVFRVLN
jgi:homoserine dehydrogenase